MNKIILKGNYGEVESSNSEDFDIYSFGYTWCKLPSKIDGYKDSAFRIMLGQIAKRQDPFGW